MDMFTSVCSSSPFAHSSPKCHPVSCLPAQFKTNWETDTLGRKKTGRKGHLGQEFFYLPRHDFPLRVMRNYSWIHWLLKFLWRPCASVIRELKNLTGGLACASCQAEQEPTMMRQDFLPSPQGSALCSGELLHQELSLVSELHYSIDTAPFAWENYRAHLPLSAIASVKHSWKWKLLIEKAAAKVCRPEKWHYKAFRHCIGVPPTSCNSK